MTRSTSSQKKIRYSLFFRVFLYFAIVLTVSACLLGLIFINLYSQNLSSTYGDQLKTQAKRLASDISIYVINDDKSHYNSYILPWQEVLQIENTDVWIVPNPDTPMDSAFSNTQLSNANLTEDMNTVLNNAFLNKTTVSSSFDRVYGEYMMRTATPIHDAGGNVVGAVMLTTYVKNQTKMINRGKELIMFSAIVALFLSFILAVIFARQLSHPISRIRKTALELADGNYDSKTLINRKDEIGDLAITIDILADRLALDEKAQNRLEQMRMDFFANVSHELRTPITVMRGYTETLYDGIITEPAKVSQYYQRMLKECQSMERLVGDLLLLSKMQNPDFAINMEPVNLIQIIEDVLRSVNVIAAKKQILFDVRKYADRLLILGDYDRLRQMFLIIIDNAIKFSNDNSSIHITLSEENDCPKAVIRDEGIGITPEEMPNIFDKFYKSKLRQNATGSGLGLVIARQIAIRHKGTISVESTVGKGSSFTFTFQKPDDSFLSTVE